MKCQVKGLENMLQKVLILTFPDSLIPTWLKLDLWSHFATQLKVAQPYRKCESSEDILANGIISVLEIKIPDVMKVEKTHI